jgi:hypothetical protein
MRRIGVVAVSLVLVVLVALVVSPSAHAAAPRPLNKTSPANGAHGQSVSPTLKWSTSTSATSYQFCLHRSSNSQCPGTWVSARTQRVAHLSGLKGGATYEWQVRAVNAKGTTYANANKWFSFTTTSSSTAPTSGA